MALKQRRGSLAYRTSFKPSSNNLTKSTPSTLNVSSVPTDESNRNNQQTRNETLVLLPNGNSPLTQKRTSREDPENGTISPTNGNDFHMTNSRATLKPVQPSNTTNKYTLKTEKSSTTCTIQ